MDVILEALELKVKHRREGLEHETLFGVLETITLGMVLVLALHHFNGDKVLEGLVEILHPLDIQLDICKTGWADAQTADERRGNAPLNSSVFEDS